MLPHLIGCKKFLPTQGSLPFLTQVNDKGMDNGGAIGKVLSFKVFYYMPNPKP
jgi:hypothetical protein